MNRNQIIKPKEIIKDFSLLGTSFVYSFRWSLGLLHRGFNQTLPSRYIHPKVASQLLSAKTIEEQAIACLIFAAYEQKYRSGKVHEIATVLMDQNNKLVKPQLTYAWGMIDDLVNLTDSIPSVWGTPKDSLTNHKYSLNATFTGEHTINADAQQIVDGTLIKCFTTLKAQPFNQQHLWQQIAYVLLDWEDRHQINKVCWYYPRQQAQFIYPTEKLFKELPRSRDRFRQFLTENY
jgi:hypothetical protein